MSTGHSHKPLTTPIRGIVRLPVAVPSGLLTQSHEESAPTKLLVAAPAKLPRQNPFSFRNSSVRLGDVAFPPAFSANDMRRSI